MQNLHAFEHRFEALVRDIHNHLYANANVRTNEAIAQEVGKILLALMHASQKGIGGVTVLERGVRQAALHGEQSAVAELARQVADQFRAMNQQLKRYPRTTKIELDPASVAYARAQLDGVLFSGVARDWLGDAMEVFRSLNIKRLGGQFFTDQRVTDLSVRLLEFDPRNGDDFVDICAGTGGFLLAAARWVRDLGLAEERITTGTPIIHGLEVDPDLSAAANSSLISLLGSEWDFVLTADSLLTPDEWPVEVRRAVIPGTHLCLASNPPFGTKITIKDLHVLHRYDLARTWSKRSDRWDVKANRLSPRPPDILFVERNLRLLEPGRGRMALVTPYQILSGPQLGFVREWVLRNARIRAVIDLPVETFQPWTGTKTSLLVLERRTEALDVWDPAVDANHHVFMAVADQIGHDRRGHPVLEASGAVKTDLPLIAEAFAAFRSGEDPSSIYENSFAVSAERIAPENDQRLNGAFYRPNATEARSRVLALDDSAAFRVTTVGEVTSRIFFPTRFKRSYVDKSEEAVPFLGGSQISQLIPTNEKFLAADAKNLADLRVQPGWILITRSGSTGIVSSVPKEWAGAAFSEHVIRVVPDPDKLDPHYLETFLRSSVGQALLASGIFGSVIDEITPEHVASIPIPVPKAKKAVAAVSEPLARAMAARDEAIRGITDAVAEIEAVLIERSLAT